MRRASGVRVNFVHFLVPQGLLIVKNTLTSEKYGVLTKDGRKQGLKPTLREGPWVKVDERIGSGLDGNSTRVDFGTVGLRTTRR